MSETIAPTREQLLAGVAVAARNLLQSVAAADEAGISQALILPVLVAVMRESGITVPGLPKF